MANKLKLLYLGGLFSLMLNSVSAQLSVYSALPGDRNKSQHYSVKIAEATATGETIGVLTDSYTYQLLRSEAPGSSNTDMLSDNHWTTFSFSPNETAKQVKLEISKVTGSISKVEFRPSTNVNTYTIANGKISVTMNSDKMVTAIINDDIKQPLFIFCDPKETNVPQIGNSNVFVVSGTTLEKPLRIKDIPNGTQVVYFGPGIHYMYDKTDATSSNGAGLVITSDAGSRINSNVINQIYIAGGAFVVGAIRAPKVNNLTVNGRGILAGQVDGIPYCSQGNKYLEDRIYNSAIVMADYNSKTDRKHIVDGITIFLPLKYSIQVGAYATVKNTKMFAYHQTTDGIGAEAYSKISNNFIKTNDDMVKIYNDNMEVRNTYLWHQNNGACFQLGWNESQGKNSIIKNTFLIRDDAAESYMNESHWDNHSFINWHSTGYTNIKPVHDSHIFDSINAVGMPPIKVWRFMAINLNGKYPAGTLGGILKNLQVKNVNLGAEKLASYIGATINGSTAEVHFTNAKLGGVCINKTNIVQDGAVTVTPTSNLCFVPTVVPVDPTNFLSTNKTYKTISLSWRDNSDLEDYFVLERSLNGTDGWAEIARPTGESYLDQNLSAETIYFYRIKAVNNIGPSNTLSISVTTNGAPTVVPVAPSELLAIAQSDKSILLSWKDNSLDEDNFLVQQLTNSEWVTIATLSPGVNNTLVKELLQETSYTFRIIAKNSIGNSEPSNSASATTKAGFNSGILSNGSFEDGLLFDENGAWTLQPGNVTLSSEFVKSGLFSAKFQNPSGNYLEPEFNLKSLFACYGAGSYTVSMSVYVPASNIGKVELYFTPQNVYFQPNNTRDQWITLTQKVNYTAGTEIKLKAKTYNGPSGAMFFVDDIAITTTNAKCITHSISTYHNNIEISLFPNPATNQITLETKHLQKDAILRIYSLSGKIEKEIVIENTKMTIDVSSISKGLKMIEISNTNGVISRSKVVLI